ncbi:retrotransposon protein, putative, ty1-copia subclass [Tanacetum coccineum]
MSHYIPFEIQSEIMKRLPVKSLVQFRSVSKQWKSFIDNPKFIKNYHINHTNPQHHLLVRYKIDSIRTYTSIIDDKNTFPKQKFPLTAPEPLNLLSHAKTLGSVDGLVCFIISFDLKTEKLCEVCIPKRLAGIPSVVKVVKVNESLALLEFYKEGGKSVCGVWMRKDGVNQPFTKIYTVKVKGKMVFNTSVLGFRNNGDVVLGIVGDDSEESIVEVYEPSSGLISGVGIKGEYDIRAIRILIAIAAYYDYEIWQMDVKTAFLNGHLSEEVYMEQPEGFVNPKYPNHVCKLKRSIYGLKQASRQWNKRFDDEIKKFGFTQNPDEPCVYLKASGSYVAILILYVDDILLMGNNIPMLQDVKSYLGRSFAMKDLGDAAYILGIKIYRDRSKRLIGLNQSAYIEKILKRFYMENSKRGTIPMQEKLKLSKSQGASTPAEKQRMQNIPYASAIGSIMYVVRCTRPDVAFAQNMTSRFQQNPGNMERELRVSCYTDAGYLTDADNLKSQTGYVFVLNRGVVDWKSTNKIRKFIYGLGIVPSIEEPISMYCDNTGAIAIAKDDGVTKGARHFRAKVHYLRETIKLGDVKIEKVDTDDNLADLFTKALAFPKHSELTRNIGMLPASSFM